jgi:dolichol-phosphate mannosyltransferase
MFYEFTVILPTLNEEDSIRQTINTVFAVMEEHMLVGQVLVIDDNSKDNTVGIVKAMQDRYEDLNYIVRETDHGLSQSVYDGFIAAKSEVFIVMDADGQHPIEKIPELYGKICDDYDIVIGSRYMDGGGIEKWDLKRRIISIGATVIARLFFPQITDPGSGFFAIRKSVIEGAMLKPRGYKILVEILGKGVYEDVIEIPIHFNERIVGESKLKSGTIVEYIKQLWDLSLFTVTHRGSPVEKEVWHVVKFMMVGLTGIVVNTFFLKYFTEGLGLYYLIAAVGSIEISILSNFILNEKWTFQEPENKVHGFLGRMARYNMISLGGLVINLIVLAFLTSVIGIYYLISNVIGILCGFVFNYVGNRIVTWGGL